MNAILVWIKANKTVSAIIIGVVACCLVALVAFGTGYIKGCSDKKADQKQEEKK